METTWVNVSNLRFTNPDINRKFEAFPDLGVLDVVKQIREGRLDPHAKFKRVVVHKDKDDQDLLWCENNRTLYVLRKAGVKHFNAKFKNNDFASRCHGIEAKERRKDPNFWPMVRGESELPLVSGGVDWGSSSSDVRLEEESESVLPGLLAAASGALLAGYASWKLLNSAQSDHKK